MFSIINSFWKNTKSLCGTTDVVQISASYLKCTKLEYKSFHASRLSSHVSYLKTQLYVAFRWTDWREQQSWRNFLNKKEQMATVLWYQEWKIINKSFDSVEDEKVSGLLWACWWNFIWISNFLELCICM